MDWFNSQFARQATCQSADSLTSVKYGDNRHHSDKITNCHHVGIANGYACSRPGDGNAQRLSPASVPFVAVPVLFRDGDLLSEILNIKNPKVLLNIAHHQNAPAISGLARPGCSGRFVFQQENKSRVDKTRRRIDMNLRRLTINQEAKPGGQRLKHHDRHRETSTYD